MLKLKFFFFFSLDAKSLNVEPLRKIIYIYIYMRWVQVNPDVTLQELHIL